MFTTAGSTPPPRIKHSLTTTITKLAAGAAISLAFLTTAAPAMAMEDPSSPGGSSGERTPATPVRDDPFLDVSSAALGALAGIALGGVGLGITLGIQRHRDHAAMPTV
ncbi:MAG: hypothetical protein QOF10_4398 [Kribbellaceae bacterium]|jgi:hypothetical protein|nr:hypothetical protein [Kribbellaceae bacterium]